MLKKLWFAFASLLALSANANGGSSNPPVDVNTAVENPSLVRAMNRVVSENSDSAKDVLLIELNRANYLAAVLSDGGKQPLSFKPGQTVIEKGTRLGVLSAGKDGKNYLLLFSDWKALRAYTKLQVTGWILPARDAWSLALQGSTYHGVVINPAHNALPLERPMLEFLSKNGGK